MTKEIILTIKGEQKYTAEEVTETVTETGAEYYLKNNSHYVIFEEETEGFKEKTRSVLKFRKGYAELTRKGLVQSHMVFEEDKLYMTAYRTPFGVVPMGIHTKRLQITEEENTIRIEAEYELEAHEEHMADCRIEIMIQAK